MQLLFTNVVRFTFQSPNEVTQQFDSIDRLRSSAGAMFGLVYLAAHSVQVRHPPTGV